uniref:HAT C-terminal dimerisation domain-containing protein n=1 Tax=Chenopodium quinoa TaxID=63459 RepID=A0A803LSM8_CHEQI
MAHGMKRKHDKYWENVNNINLMLYVAVVLDPRRNMQYVKWAIDDKYDLDKGKELYDKIRDALNSLYEHYASQQTQGGSSPSNMVDLTTRDMESFEDWHDMAEFEFERDIGSQNWWKNRGERYPIVALMAKDVLAIPVSTVASESAFSMGGRVLDPFCSSLSSNMVEALICAQDWLRNTRGPLEVEENLEDIERIEEELSPFIEQPSSGVVDDYIGFGPAALLFACYLSYSIAAALMLFAVAAFGAASACFKERSCCYLLCMLLPSSLLLFPVGDVASLLGLCFVVAACLLRFAAAHVLLLKVAALQAAG